jgi:hypothetical protein
MLIYTPKRNQVEDTSSNYEFIAIKKLHVLLTCRTISLPLNPLTLVWFKILAMC